MYFHDILGFMLHVNFAFSYHVHMDWCYSIEVHDEVYSIQHYVIKFVSDFRHDFLRVLRFPLPIKNDRNHITEILLQVGLNIITLTLTIQSKHD